MPPPPSVRSLRIAATFFVLVIALLLLVPTRGDGSYECHGTPAWRIVHPHKIASAEFRRNFFDVEDQCNVDARARGIEAGIVAVPALALYLYARRRRRLQSVN